MANLALFAFSCHPYNRCADDFSRLKGSKTLVLGDIGPDITIRRAFWGLGDIVIEEKINKLFGDADCTGFGTGWWSGILSAFFGFLSCGGVLCLHFPQLLTSPELRPHYPMHATRALIQCLIVAAIVFGVISAILRKKRILALTGMLFAAGATALGGSRVEIKENPRPGAANCLGWVFLDLFFVVRLYLPARR